MALPPSRRLTRPAGAGTDPNLQPLFENLEILNGARGNGMDRAVLLRDLVDLGVATMRKSGTGVFVPAKPDAGTGNGGDGGIVEPPEQPRGVTANGGFSTILIDWEKPKYLGHAYTEVLRSATDNFSTAVRIATTTANLQSDQVGGDKVYFYWVRFVNLLDVKGPVQSTNGVRGETQADIGEILDKLKGQVDESFLTPSFNSKLVNMKELTDQIPDLARDFGDLSIDVGNMAIDVGDLSKDVGDLTIGVGDLSVKLTNELIRLDGEIVDVSESKFNMLAEATLEAALGVDTEGYTRRKATAEINLTQKVLITQTGAMAQQILEIRAQVDQDSASITENKTAIVRIDEFTKKTIESITQKLDIQESVIDGNTAKILENNQTIVRIDGDLSTLDSSITSITGMLTEQRSDIDGNTATITSNSQTIVTQGGKIDQTIADLGSFTAETNYAISSITTKVDLQESKIADNTASINSTSQTVVIIGRKVDENSADLEGVITSITTITDRLTTQESAIGANTATISDHSQTLVQQGGLLNQTIADLTGIKGGSSDTIASLSARISEQKSAVDSNTAKINTTSQTLVVVGGKVDRNGNEIAANKQQISSITDILNTQQSEIDGNKAVITEHTQTLVQQNVKLDQAIADIAGVAGDGSETITSLTAKINAQKSEIDSNKAGIATNSQTLVLVKGDVTKNTNGINALGVSITSLTDVVNTQKSEIDSNTATISTQSQTIVQQGSELRKAIQDLDLLDEKTTSSVNSLTAKIDQQKSVIDSNTAGITSNSQTLVLVGQKVDGSIASIASLTDRVNTQESAIENNTAIIGSHTQTLVQQGGKIDKAIADIAALPDNSEAIISLTQKVDSQESSIDNNAANIETNTKTLVIVGETITSLSQRTDEISATNDIINEAALEAATAVDREAEVRRTATAKIKLTQTAIVNDVAAQAKQVLELTAKVGENSAGIVETKNVVVQIDTETKQAIASLTQITDEQRSEIDGNIASINQSNQTLVMLDQELYGVKQDVISVTESITQQQSEIDDNTASITSQAQTIVTIDDKVSSNTATINVVSESLDLLQSTVEDNTASIITNNQTIVTVDNKANATNAAVSSLSQQMTTLTSELGTTKSQVTQNSQTIATINADGSSAYKAQWGVKATVGDITAGIGLTVKKEEGKPDISQCTVIAGQFSVGYIKSDGSGETVYPFFVGTNPTTGAPGVFIDTAFIKAAKIQDLVAGEVVADNIKVGATLTAPYIKGGKIEIGSSFTVNENGNMVASNATVTGTVNANAGVFNNVTIEENCNVKGTIYANKIVGDVYNADSFEIQDREVTNNQTVVVYTWEIPKQNFTRKVEFGGIRVSSYDYTVRYYLNNSIVYSKRLTSIGSYTPIYIAYLAANTDGIMRVELTAPVSATIFGETVKVASFKA